MTQPNHPLLRERLNVLVPCLNEERGIETTVASIRAVVPRLDVDVGIVMIDDGSVDGTRKQMESLCGRFSECSMIVNERNLGLGRSLINTYGRLAPESWITVVPGDNELMFESIENHLAVRDQFDIVLGYLGNPVIRPVGRRAASAAFTLVARALYGFPYRYLNGLKLYRCAAFQGLEIVSSGHAFNAELLAKALLRNPELRIGEVPFAARGRTRGASKAIRPASVARAVGDVVRGFRAVGSYRKLRIRQEDDQACAHDGRTLRADAPGGARADRPEPAAERDRRPG